MTGNHNRMVAMNLSWTFFIGYVDELTSRLPKVHASIQVNRANASKCTCDSLYACANNKWIML